MGCCDQEEGVQTRPLWHMNYPEKKVFESLKSPIYLKAEPLEELSCHKYLLGSSQGALTIGDEKCPQH